MMIQDIAYDELGKARERVKSAIDAKQDWRTEALEDYRFVMGKQWSDADKANMAKNDRPAITINRCRPIVNLLCGYAAQNETEPDFLPRSAEDASVARVAKGITKYILDKAQYQTHKKRAFRDKIITGLGAYWVSCEFDYDKLDSEIRIERLHPFDIFVDPESLHDGLEDAEFCGRYSWESPEKLVQIYPERASEIQQLAHKLDDTEDSTSADANPLWYNRSLKKVRVVQYWYRKYESEERQLGTSTVTVPVVNVHYMTFADTVLLEQGKSPYKHKHFPLVLDYCYRYDGSPQDGAEIAGIIRDVKDAQRELNKNRSQRMNIVNKQSLGVRLWSGPVDASFKEEIKRNSTKPGADIFVPPNVSYQDMAPNHQSIGNIELENQANSDFYNISGITPESLSGSVGAMSGKAIDLRQSVTTVQTAEIFDKSKEAEQRIMLLLWGEQGKPGLIPQFYNKEKVYRIMGEDGQNEFITVAPGTGIAMTRQPVLDMFGQQQLDENGNPMVRLIYDLTLFDFDIVVTTSATTATARKANLYQLLEAKQAGVDIPLDIIIGFMDFPGKEDVKQRIREQSESPKLPEFKVTGQLNDLPAEALSAALQSIGVNIPPEQILQERLALKGRSIPNLPPQQPNLPYFPPKPLP